MGRMRRRVAERYRWYWPACDYGETIATNGPECLRDAPQWGALPTNSVNPARQRPQNDIALMVRAPNSGYRSFPGPGPSGVRGYAASAQASRPPVEEPRGHDRLRMVICR